MTVANALIRAAFLMMGFMFVVQGCVVEPREGYYDRDHHRWYHEHAWHDCEEHDVHCGP
jgi:hypothetical protein